MKGLAGPLRYTRLLAVEGQTLKVLVRREYAAVLGGERLQERLEGALATLLSRRVQVRWVCPSPAQGEEAGSGESADLPPAPPTSASGGGRFSKREMDQIIADGAVREMMDRFNAAVVNVEKKPPQSDAGRREGPPGT
jgi:hypothetical protein